MKQFFFDNNFCFVFFFIVYICYKLESYCEIVMFIWWHRFWNNNESQEQQFDTSLLEKRTNHIDKIHQTPSQHLQHQNHHQLPYSVHHNCKSQSKCIRKLLTDHSSRMHSFCSVIILIHCFNVFVLAIASENLSNAQQQPCDRTRRVFTDMQGEISNGPPGYNYTQVSSIFIRLI